MKKGITILLLNLCAVAGVHGDEVDNDAYYGTYQDPYYRSSYGYRDARYGYGDYSTGGNSAAYQLNTNPVNYDSRFKNFVYGYYTNDGRYVPFNTSTDLDASYPRYSQKRNYSRPNIPPAWER